MNNGGKIKYAAKKVWDAMKKTVIILNGRGEVGKDTLCDMISGYYPVMNVSSITPIKEIARQCGWTGEKNDKSRMFLSDLKRLLTNFNDYPTLYLLRQYEQFKNSDNRILFVQIREGTEIDKLKAQIDCPCFTLLVKRSSQDFGKWGNVSDDEVESYEYDYIFDNCKPLEVTGPVFKSFIDDILHDEVS